MAHIKPFKAIRPANEYVKQVAALPYDVYNRQEALVEVTREPLSFLHVDRAETWFDDSVDTYDPKVYQKAREVLESMIEDHILISEEKDCYYIYELTMNGRTQTGIAACISVDDYLDKTVKKHENTVEVKEIDRINHVDILSAQTGPIFLAYRSQVEINQVVDAVKKDTALYDFVADDDIRHRVWVIGQQEQLEALNQSFAALSDIYIADGHHRCASAVKVALKRRAEHPKYQGGEEFNYFLSVFFPDEELMIMPYNRVVKDLNGLDHETFMAKVLEVFEIEACGNTAVEPDNKFTFGMYLEDQWYKLTAKDEFRNEDAVEGLDVSILQDYLLNPILGIKNPKKDKRIDFVGGIRGTKELEKRCTNDMKVAFSMYPTSIQELFSVADEHRLMPPKSTWFEPKLRSGLFIHKIEE